MKKLVAFVLLAIFAKRMHTVFHAPDEMMWGNCHWYAWQKLMREGGSMHVEPSERCMKITHAYHVSPEGVRSEFVPRRPRKGLLALVKSPLFWGRVKRTECKASVDQERSAP